MSEDEHGYHKVQDDPEMFDLDRISKKFDLDEGQRAFLVKANELATALLDLLRSRHFAVALLFSGPINDKEHGQPLIGMSTNIDTKANLEDLFDVITGDKVIVSKEDAGLLEISNKMASQIMGEMLNKTTTKRGGVN